MLEGNIFRTPQRWLSEQVRVLVLGAGGTGGEVLDQLCRLNATLVALGHPGGLAVTVLDADEVSMSNVGRQRFGPSDVGHNKAVTLVNRINLFYGLDWEGVPVRFDAGDASMQGLVSQFNLVITAVDKVEPRRQVAQSRLGWGRDATLWLDFGNGETTGQAILGELSGLERPQLLDEQPGNTRRLPHVVDLFPEMDDDGDDTPSCSVAEAIAQQTFGINAALVAPAMASMIWPLFRRGYIEHHGLFVDVARGTCHRLTIDERQWATFGYEPEEAPCVETA